MRRDARLERAAVVAAAAMLGVAAQVDLAARLVAVAVRHPGHLAAVRGRAHASDTARLGARRPARAAVFQAVERRLAAIVREPVAVGVARLAGAHATLAARAAVQGMRPL